MKGSDGLGDQDVIHNLIKIASDALIEVSLTQVKIVVKNGQ